MYDTHTVGVVVPAYNEADFVGDVVRDVPDYVDRIYVVDDCSDDGTHEAITEGARVDAAARDDSATDAADLSDGDLLSVSDSAAFRRRTASATLTGRVVAIRHRENLGAGGAIKTGYLAALADGVDVVATIDADGQMDPSILSRFLDPIVDGEADYTKGDRLSDREYRRAMPTFRLVGNFALTALTRIASGQWTLTDPQNGYTAISTDALDRIELEEMYEYYGYLNDLLVRLSVADCTVEDVPMEAIYDDEVSHIDYGDYIWRVSRMLLRNFAWRLSAQYPPDERNAVAPFYLFGAAMFGVGLVQFLRSAASLVRSDASPAARLASGGASVVAGGVAFLVVFLLDGLSDALGDGGER
jgi:glycosyltransferase involved in cell wall biosynthesis